MKTKIFIAKRVLYATLFLSCLLVSLISCKKDLKTATTPLEAKTTKDAIFAFPLNWENTDYMPTPSGTTILVPWANGSVKGFSSDIWYDIKASDGWELVYNVFNTSSLPPNPWFVLYNRYRGLFRIYVYVTTSGFTQSSYLTSGLNLAPNAKNSSMLNFIGQDLIDVNQNQTVGTKMEPTQMATGTWYASQYEIAYDRNMATSTYQEEGLNWTLKWTNVQQISLGGDLQGSVNGTIGTKAGSFDLAGNLMQGALEATGLAVFSNNKGPDANHPENNNKLGLPSYIFKAVSEGLTSGLSGVVKNIASGIFGGNSNNSQEVNLTVNATLKLTGSISGSGALIPDPGLGLGISGTSNSQSASGYVPAYLSTMGIFNLTGKPAIIRTTRKERGPDIDGIPYNRYVTDYMVDNTVFNSVFVTNNAVINSSATGATIQNIRKQVVLLNPSTSDYFRGYGTLETIGLHTAYTGFIVTTTYDVEHSSYPQNNFAAVRVIFDVVPNNGAPKSTIVKTFIANVVNG